jgi:hypothetical protein
MHCVSDYKIASQSRAGRGLVRSLALLAFFSSLLWSSLATAQPRMRLERFGFDKLPDLKVYLSFVEEDGTVVTGRQANDFKLIIGSADSGVGRSLVTFDQANEPIFVVGVVQVGGTVDEKVLAEAKSGMRRINDAVGKTPGGRMGLLAYSSKTLRLQEFGTSTETDSAIGKLALDTESSEMQMLDALRTAIDLLKQQEKSRRKLIVLVSDGIDVNNEKKYFTEIGTRAQQGGIVIDTVGYNAFDASKLKFLREMTNRCYGTDRVAKTPADIGQKFNAIVDEIEKQYLITFPLSIVGEDQDLVFQIQTASGKEAYSNTIQEKLPSKAKIAVAPGAKEKTKWWLYALIAAGVLGAILIIAKLLKKKPVEAPVATPAPQPGKPDAPAPRMSNKTVALEAAGDITMGWVMGLTGKYKDVTFKLKDRAVMGTAADCDIVIEDGFMSHRHAEIRKVEGGFKLVDLGATNGVIVNDKRVKEHFLIDNDNFRLGRTEFKFKSILG